MTTAAHGVDGKVLALRLLREGLHVKLISDRTALMVREIREVAHANGLVIDEGGVPHVRGSVPRATPMPDAVAAVQAAQGRRMAEVVQMRPAVRDLLVAGRSSSRKATVALAARADALLERLRAQVEREQAEELERAEKRRKAEAAKARALAEREAARAEVERLREQLRAAERKARVRLPQDVAHFNSKPPGQNGWQPDYPVDEVRAWARANGLSISGRYLPKATVAAWREATGTAS